ncbi:MAG TPA: phage tail protein [Allosphingosinicella sp.]|jgi:phage tail-like protein
MNAGSCYIFATAEQKQACLRTGLAETMLLDPKAGEPLTGFDGARLLVAGPDGRLFAIDGQGRLTAGGNCGPAVGAASRIVVGRTRISVLARDGLHQFDRRTLQHLLTLDAGDTIDIAAAAGDGLWRLGNRRVERFGASGRPAGDAVETGPAERIAVAGGTIFLLYPGPERLELLAVGDGRPVAIDLTLLLADAGAGVGPAPARFGGSELVHGTDHVLLWRRERDQWPDYLVLDPEGSVVARGRHDHPSQVGMIALACEDLVTAFEDGLVKRFAGAGTGGGARWLTPALDAGSHSETWVRAEVNARLPEGATLSLRWAALPEQPLVQSIEAVQADRVRSTGDRLASATDLLRDHLSPEFTYRGQPGDDGRTVQRLDFPLHKDAGPFLWLYLKLRRNDAARMPVIETLSVYHGSDRLIDHLPAIYRGSGDADGTLKRLVGVLEATTHGIDGQIATLAARLDPERTESRWLPELAATLGLPFDEALPTAMQRRLVGAAGALLVGRGTRAGFAALFEALFPGRPVAIRDRATQRIPVALGGGGFAGSRLPALLTGPSDRSPRLSRRLVLGRTRLSPVENAGRIAPMAEVVVRVPATGGERRRLGKAIRQMAEVMVPAGVRLTLRWAPWRTGRPAARADGLTLVEDPEPLELGDGRLGRAVLGGRRRRIDATSLGRGGHRLL